MINLINNVIVGVLMLVVAVIASWPWLKPVLGAALAKVGVLVARGEQHLMFEQPTLPTNAIRLTLTGLEIKGRFIGVVRSEIQQATAKAKSSLIVPS